MFTAVDSSHLDHVDLDQKGSVLAGQFQQEAIGVAENCPDAYKHLLSDGSVDAPTRRAILKAAEHAVAELQAKNIDLADEVAANAAIEAALEDAGYSKFTTLLQTTRIDVVSMHAAAAEKQEVVPDSNALAQS